jgi:hypothetical protein
LALPSNDKVSDGGETMKLDNLKLCPFCQEHFTASVCPKCGNVRQSQPMQLEAKIDPQDLEPDDAYEGLEKDLHGLFKADMDRRGVHYVYARTDQRSTIEMGLPDFHLFYTAGGICRGCAVEFKRKGGKLKEKQKAVIDAMRQKQIPVSACWTLRDAIAFARAHLGC